MPNHLRQLLAVVALTATSAVTAVAVGPDEATKFDLSSKASLGFVTAGGQYDLGINTLTPVPTRFPSFSWGASAATFVVGPLGWEGTFSVLAYTEASSPDVSDTVVLLRYVSVQSGPALRLGATAFGRAIALTAAGGVDVSFLWLASDYKDLFPAGTVFFDIDPGIGWYARAGVNVYGWEIEELFVGLAVQYTQQNAAFTSGLSLSGTLIQVPIYFGFSF